ncbi:MAG TPA: hypothetical protein VFB96_01175 [Pirellulaceae bacterium]|nr:hypothetical protein [Pirellulaceae bacterium]
MRRVSPQRQRRACHAPHFTPAGRGSTRIAGRFRDDLARIGKPIGPYDLQIAAIAVANGLTLVTHNVKEFSRLAGLVVEDWQT